MGILSKVVPFLSGFWVKFGIIVAIMVGLTAFGGRMGYDMRDRIALKAEQKAAQQTAIDIQNYKNQIQQLLTTQHGLSSQLEQALIQSSNVVTKTVTQTIIKEVHDHPTEYTCSVPASGMSILANQATTLNNIRGKQ